MFRLFEKIKWCRMKFVAWSRKVFGNTKTRLEKQQVALKDLTNLVQINTLREEINGLLHQEEVFWRQRPWAIWLLVGDKITKLFHKRASQQQRKNHIDGLMDGDGFWRTDKQTMGAIAEDYFKTIFATSHPSNVDEVLGVVDGVVTEEMNQSLN